MKKIIIACIFAVSIILPSCLDVDAPGYYSDDDVWSSIQTLDPNIRGMYADALYNGYVCEYNFADQATDAFSDLLKYTYGSAVANNLFRTANLINPDNPFSNWNDRYKHIKKMNDFLVAVSSGSGAGFDQTELAVRIAEVRFLRAFIYQDLVVRHGGVILRTDETGLDGPDEAPKARSTKEQCWNFIIDEYQKAADVLPEKWTEYGRATKGAAYGMMARAALYAGQWDKALAAAGEVEKLSSIYGLEALDKIFTTANNKELILAVYFSNINGHLWDQTAAPSGDQTAFGSAAIGGVLSPTDEFASSYDVKVGDVWRAFSWADVKNGTITNPWANRDPRFAATILHNGATWRNRTIQLYEGGQDGFFAYSITNTDMRKSPTGYTMKKFLSREIDYKTTQKSKEYWVEMRYAEVLLIMSEAYARKGVMDKAYEYLNKIRTRAGMPDLAQKLTWDGYFADLQKERICELGGEGHRFWDLRRWGNSANVLNGSRVHGVKITGTSPNFAYERVDADVTDRIFLEKYNVFPIPQAEILRNRLCVQDDIWK